MMTNPIYKENKMNGLSFEAAVILNRFRCAVALRELAADEESPKDRKDDSKPGDARKSKTDEEIEYIQYRLREIAAWERAISGGAKRR
jgi:hypothetical protein